MNVTVCLLIKKCCAFAFVLAGRVKLSVVVWAFAANHPCTFRPECVEVHRGVCSAKMVHVKTSVEESPVAVLECGGLHVGYMLQDSSRSSRKVGFCAPFVANTPTLATHSPDVAGDLTEDGYFYVTNEVTLEAAQCTIFSTADTVQRAVPWWFRGSCAM